MQFAKRTVLKKYIWGQAGLLGDYGNLGFQLGLNYKIKKHFFSVRYYQNSDDFDFSFSAPPLNAIQEIHNFSFMYGLSFGNKWFKIIPMAGISIGQGNWRNNKVDTVVTGGGGMSFFTS